MLDTMFRHPDMVKCAMYLALFYACVYFFKESTPYFLLVKLRVFKYRIKSFVISRRSAIYLGKFGGDQNVPKDFPTF